MVRVSPRITIAKKAANTGAVDARMLVRVGPRWRIPAIARLDVRNGRNNPISAKITTALVPQYHSCKNQGEKSQNNTVDPSIDMSAPVWLRPYFNPRFCNCTPTANKNAEANARTTGVVRLIASIPSYGQHAPAITIKIFKKASAASKPPSALSPKVSHLQRAQ
jgi:hypothetical protein